MSVIQALSMVAWVAWLGCAIFIYIHAFQRSVGTGFMVLCIPCYIFYYAFSQFEHPKKGWIVGGMIGAFGLYVVLSSIGFIGSSASAFTR
jgi:benzodiazapine receptor